MEADYEDGRTHADMSIYLLYYLLYPYSINLGYT